MIERELISSNIIETIGKYTIVQIKERLLDINGKPYGPILIWYDVCLDHGDGDIVASYNNVQLSRKWAKEN